MAFSRSLTDRVRQALRDRRGVSERKMFGCMIFKLRGKMLVGVWENSLIVRLGPERAAEALKQDYVGEFGASGRRPMKGWIVVGPDGLDTDKQLADWIELAVQFVETLPRK